jgi:signal transduction histidine kinase
LPHIACYADQINQVIFNLLCNAIDAIDEKLKMAGERNFTPTITVSTQISDSTTTIHIKDNGIGLSEANKDRIFEPFFTTKPAGYGIGLGLATSQRIVEDTHGGRLTCVSHLGQGSEFIIQLPIGS